MGEAIEEEERLRRVPALRYLVVWVLLLLLTAATFLLARMHLGAWGTPVAIAIALVKSSLVALFFMHLWDSQGANRMVLVVACIFVLLLTAGVLSDVTTRFPLALPNRRVDHGLAPQRATETPLVAPLKKTEGNALPESGSETVPDTQPR